MQRVAHTNSAYRWFYSDGVDSVRSFKKIVYSWDTFMQYAYKNYILRSFNSLTKIVY